MDDRMLVAALRSGDARALAGVYDTYADRLLAYAATLLGDRDAAADAVHDAVLVARERIGQLREPDKLRPWLYAIVRNECLRQLRDRRRSAPLAAAGEVIDPDAPELDRDLRADELRELVWAAAAALNDGEREVLELSVRHGLSGAELADALGVSLNTAHALTSRSRAQLERSLGALLVARTGRPDCPELAGLLAGWDGTLTPLLRKRLARHVDRCEVCGDVRRRRLSPAALLAGTPFLIAPPELRERILRDVAYGQEPAELARRAGPWAADGFPVPLDRRRRTGTGRWAAAGVVLLAALLAAGLALRPDSGTDRLADAGTADRTGTTLPLVRETGPAAPVTTASTAPTAPPAATTAPPAATTTAAGPPPPTTAPATTAPATAGPTTAAPGTARPTPTPTAVPTTPAPTPTPTPAGTVTTRWALLADGCPTTWRARLTAVVSGTTATAVTATVAGRSYAMSGQGRGLWTVLVSLPADTDLSWTATAATAAGPVAAAPQPLRHDCDVIG